MPRSGDERKQRSQCHCSFCGRPQGQLDQLISSGYERVFICSECVAACSELLAEDPPAARSQVVGVVRDIPKPHQIYEVLNEYVVGQERAKRILSVAVYNHYKRLTLGETSDGVELQKSNVLLIGPTGSGKTLLARTLARILEVPFAIADATSLTEAGYVGDDVENILLKLYQAADFNLERAQRGIVYIDEIDKLARRSDQRSLTRDVSGEGVQQGLLKILEGAAITLTPQPGRKPTHQEPIHIDSTNILFICGGAFDGLEQIVKQRVTEHPVGFAPGAEPGEKVEESPLIARALPEDLLRFGLIPEFIGRLPVIASLGALTAADMVRILVEPRNSLLKQYQKFFEWEGVELRLEPAALEEIAQEAIARATGARALRSIIEEILLDIMYDLPSLTGVYRCLVTEDTVRERSAPLLLRHTESDPQARRESQTP